MQVHSQEASELKPVKNFREEGAWAYPGIAQFFWVPIISGTGKAIRTLNFVRTFIGSIRTKSRENFGKSSRESSQGVPKIFSAVIYGAHCAAIFAIAQLSCWVLPELLQYYFCQVLNLVLQYF